MVVLPLPMTPTASLRCEPLTPRPRRLTPPRLRTDAGLAALSESSLNVLMLVVPISSGSCAPLTGILKAGKGLDECPRANGDSGEETVPTSSR